MRCKVNVVNAGLCKENTKTYRDAGTGGQWGKLAPRTLKLWGRRPPTLDCESRSFLFLFVFARELGSLPKNSGPNPGSF